MNGKIVLGTRGSDLARIQAQMVERALREKWPQLVIETRVIKTQGDTSTIDSAKIDAQAGRKGLFTGEIERSLVNGDIDIAVHSAKDLPSDLTPETQIAAVLPRAAVDDVLVTKSPNDLDSLPAKAIVATGSVRRRHQLLWRRSDLEVVDLRGNVPTRLRKLATERWHGVVLARAGIERLGLSLNEAGVEFENTKLFGSILPRDVFVPAGGQGVIAIQIRRADNETGRFLESLNDSETRLCLRAEREFLRLLQGDCNQPVGVIAAIDGNEMEVRAQVFDPGATTPREAMVTGHFEDAELLAATLFAQVKVGNHADGNKEK